MYNLLKNLLDINWSEGFIFLARIFVFAIGTVLSIRGNFSSQLFLPIFPLLISIFIITSGVIISWKNYKRDVKEKREYDFSASSIFSQQWISKYLPFTSSINKDSLAIFMMLVIISEFEIEYLAISPNFKILVNATILLLGLVAILEAIADLFDAEQIYIQALYLSKSFTAFMAVIIFFTYILKSIIS